MFYNDNIVGFDKYVFFKINRAKIMSYGKMADRFFYGINLKIIPAD
jgi:hypothetical protein